MRARRRMQLRLLHPTRGGAEGRILRSDTTARQASRGFSSAEWAIAVAAASHDGLRWRLIVSSMACAAALRGRFAGSRLPSRNVAGDLCESLKWSGSRLSDRDEARARRLRVDRLLHARQ